MTTPAPSSAAPEPTPEPEPQQAAEPKTQPEPQSQPQKSDNWQERFAGMQRAFNAERDAKVALQSQLNTTTSRVSELEKLLEEASKTTGTLTTDLQTEKERLSALEGQVARNRLIMEKFPHLAGFEGEGLLPSAPIDQLEAVLTKFQEKLASEQNLKTLQYQQGGIPNPPTTPKQGTEQGDAPRVLLDKAIQAQINGDLKSYESLMKEYYRKVSVIPTS